MEIDQSLKERVPLIQKAHIAQYSRILENQYAPRWNARCGDRLIESDLPALDQFSERLRESPVPANSDWLDRWMRSSSLNSPYFQKVVNGHQERVWMSRMDIRDRLHEIVPVDADLSRLVLNPTSGTTGMPVQVPNTPLGVAHYQPIILETIRRHGVDLRPQRDEMAAVQICSQSHTMTYATVHSYYDGAGFAKINLPPAGRNALSAEWNSVEHPDRFLKALSPQILTGDPFAFETYMDFEIDYRPLAVLSTASTLSPALRKRMEDFFRCPVVDFYSSNETGPLAYSCPEHPDRFHTVASDIYLELLTPSGIVQQGQGQLLVSGGRNPLVPLLRYNTGDVCSLEQGLCSCGKSGLIRGLKGRPSVFFHNLNDARINPLDFARMLRFVPSRRHRVQQNKDRSLDIFVDPGKFALDTYANRIQEEARKILDGAPVRVHTWDPNLEDAYPYEVIL